VSRAVRVRRGAVGDADALRAIRLEALSDSPAAYGSTYEDAVAWDDAQWREVAGRWNFFLAERDDEVVGLATGGEHERYPGTRWLFAMYVTPRARGTGAAELLVDAVSAWARAQGARELYLHVTEAVPRARAFYEKVGFRPTGEVSTLTRDTSVGLVTLVRDLA
jgi:GNAT superfamily N-acetyltransferase